MTEREQAIERLVMDAIIAHQEYLIVKLISSLEEDYTELARLATMGSYKDGWTHKEVLDYVTLET